MKKKSLLLLLLIPYTSLYASNKSDINFINNQNQVITYTKKEILNNVDLCTEILNFAVINNDLKLMQDLLKIYMQIPNGDLISIYYTKARIAILNKKYDIAIDYFRKILATNPELTQVRVELAKILFENKQLNDSEKQFRKVKAVNYLSKESYEFINNYLYVINKHNKWNIGTSFRYVRDTNINNTSSEKYIDNTPFVKNNDMLPQTAHGILYNLNLSKDFNIIHNHYFGFSNYLNGEYYWDNHNYDDLNEKISFSYRYKTVDQVFSIIPFYKKRWIAGKSYNWFNGIQSSISIWINSHFNFSFMGEYSKSHHFDVEELNGKNILFSGTLFWVKNPKQSFYIGLDFQKERVNVNRYSSNINSVRLGWIEEWERGISSKLGLSYSERKYRDEAKLGGFFPLGIIRKDKTYQANLTLWKRDWYILGLTPKLTFNWKKQISNIPSMYSYSKKDIGIIFEKSF